MGARGLSTLLAQFKFQFNLKQGFVLKGGICGSSLLQQCDERIYFVIAWSRPYWRRRWRRDWMELSVMGLRVLVHVARWELCGGCQVLSTRARNPTIH